MPIPDVKLGEKAEEWNKETLKQLLPTWCYNAAINTCFPCSPKDGQDFRKVQRGRDHCILVAASPDLKDEDILDIGEDYNGDIIVCNKLLERFVRLGVYPDWCLLLDSNPISEGQFKFMNDGDMGKDERSKLEKVKFLVSSIAEPDTISTIYINAGDSKVFMFNPHTDTGGEVALSKTWEWANGCPQLCHGGSVGTLAFQFAKELGYRRIALLGYGFCEELNPNWTMKEVGEREIMYYPDVNRAVAMPFHFLSYASYLSASIEQWQDDPSGLVRIRAEEGKEPWVGVCKIAVNISESPVMRHMPVFKQMKVREYVDWTEGI